MALLIARTVHGAIGDGPQDDEIRGQTSESQSNSQNYVQSILPPAPTPQPGVLDITKLYLPTKVAIKLHSDDYRGYSGQCVGYVKYELRNTAPHMRGNAVTWRRYITTKKAVVGSVVVFGGGKYGHVGIVTAINNETITVRSRNYHGRYIISDDVFSINSPKILGYITF